MRRSCSLNMGIVYLLWVLYFEKFEIFWTVFWKVLINQPATVLTSLTSRLCFASRVEVWYTGLNFLISERSLFSSMMFSSVIAASVPIIKGTKTFHIFNFIVFQVCLTAICLPYGQIWATIDRTVSLTWC